MFSTDFIAATEDFSTYTHHVPAPYLRKAFCLNGEIASAQITICGLGFYRLFINGQEITKGLLAPYISNPDDYLYYDQYDLAQLLRPGKNAVGILLGNGFLNAPGGRTWDLDKGAFRSAPKVALRLAVTCRDGTQSVITADPTFKTHPSPILFDDLRCGEFYDARLEIPGWNLPDFDDSGWQNAIAAVTPRGEPTLCRAESIVKRKVLRPVSITKAAVSRILPVNTSSSRLLVPLEDGDKTGFLYDFGENLAGLMRIRIRGEAGQRISIQTGECLDNDGNLNLIGIRFQPEGLAHRMIYTCAGGQEEYAPSFTYYGMRYCLVSGITEQQATPELLTFEVYSSDLRDMGWFSCSDDVVNRLQQASYNADISNFYYFPTDCPHREKNGWTGDAAVSAEQMLLWLAPENSYRVWLDNIRKAQRANGELPGIVPTAGWGYSREDSISYNGPAWDRVITDLPYYVWKYRGSTQLIRDNAGAIRNYLGYLESQRNDLGLLELGLGDYVPILYKQPKTPLVICSTLIAIDICRKSEKMLTAIGDPAGSARAEKLGSELYKAARRNLIESDGVTALGRCQSAQAMAIAYGLFTEQEKQGALDVLLDMIRVSDGHVDVGILGMQCIFDVLGQNGHMELAYHMITRPDYPSYGCWILEEDCTAMFESFRKKEERITRPNSKNHHWHGLITGWFFKYIAGIRINPQLWDVNEVEILPSFLQTLTHGEGWHQHPAGRLEAAWRRVGADISLTLTIPEGCYGTLRLPEGWHIASETEVPLTAGISTHRICPLA